MNTSVYSSEVKKDSEFEQAREMVADLAKRERRQPRIMIAKLGHDGHDCGAKVVATGKYTLFGTLPKNDSIIEYEIVRNLSFAFSSILHRLHN